MTKKKMINKLKKSSMQEMVCKAWKFVQIINFKALFSIKQKYALLLNYFRIAPRKLHYFPNLSNMIIIH